MTCRQDYAQAAVELRPDDLTEALVERFGLAEAAGARMAESGVSTPWQAYICFRRSFPVFGAGAWRLSCSAMPHSIM